MSVKRECVACHEPTEDSLLGQPKHLNREGCVAALRETIAKLLGHDRTCGDMYVDMLHDRIPAERWAEIVRARDAEIAALRARVERLEALVEAGLDAAEATEEMLRARVARVEGAARKVGACSSMTSAAGHFFYVVPQDDMLALCNALLPPTPVAPHA